MKDFGIMEGDSLCLDYKAFGQSHQEMIGNLSKLEADLMMLKPKIVMLPKRYESQADLDFELNYLFPKLVRLSGEYSFTIISNRNFFNKAKVAFYSSIKGQESGFYLDKN